MKKFSIPITTYHILYTAYYSVNYYTNDYAKCPTKYKKNLLDTAFFVLRKSTGRLKAESQGLPQRTQSNNQLQ